MVSACHGIARSAAGSHVALRSTVMPLAVVLKYATLLLPSSRVGGKCRAAGGGTATATALLSARQPCTRAAAGKVAPTRQRRYGIKQENAMPARRSVCCYCPHKSVCLLPHPPPPRARYVARAIRRTPCYARHARAHVTPTRRLSFYLNVRPPLYGIPRRRRHAPPYHAASREWRRLFAAVLHRHAVAATPCHCRPSRHAVVAAMSRHAMLSRGGREVGQGEGG